MKELEAVPVSYGFRFYNYGPYSDELTNDLDLVSSLGGVKVKYDESSYGYEITLGDNADKLIAKADDFITRHRQSIDGIIAGFGNKQAKELELIATIIYVSNRNNGENSALNEQGIIDSVARLKPKFKHSQIKTVLQDLCAEGRLHQMH